MSSTSESRRHSFAMVPPLTEDASSIDLPSTFSSPVSATTPQGPGHLPVGLVGLGISGLDDLSSSPSTAPCSVSPVLPTQLAPTHGSFNLPLKVDDFTTAPFFPFYNNLPAAPHSPLSFYGSQAMSASPSYDSSMDVSTRQTNFAGQVSGYWLPTPSSGSASRLESVPVSGSQPVGAQWTPQYFPETCVTGNPPVMPIDGISYLSTTNGDVDTRLEQPLNMAQASPKITPYDYTTRDIPMKVHKDRRSSRMQPESDNDKPYSCVICGNRFTRRSNCMEHQRRHDPKARECHPCDECGKTFGRKADLKRHKNNVRHQRSRLAGQ